MQRLELFLPFTRRSFPTVLVMEAAENHASHNLAVLGKGMFVVILQRWEYRGTSRNPRSKAQMRAPLVVMSNPLCTGFCADVCRGRDISCLIPPRTDPYGRSLAHTVLISDE